MGGSAEHSQSGSASRERVAPLVAGLALLAILALSVLWPLGRVALETAVGVINAESWDGPPARVILVSGARTLGVSLGIALLTTGLAYPGARLLARRGGAWAPLLMTPMLAPSYLAYAGWGLARAPGTMLGDALERAAASGARWAPIYTGRSLAILGLALWCVPLATLVLGASIARRDPALDDVMRLEPASPWRRLRTALSMHRAALLASAALITLAMLGSSVPLHLAQIDTLAIVVWRELSESARADWWRAWVSALPLLAIALLGSWVVADRLVGAALRDRAQLPMDERRRPVGAWTLALAGLVWLLAVGAPMALFAISIKSPDSLWRFWRLSAQGVRASLVNASLVALGTLVIAMCVSYLLSTRSRAGARAARVSVRVLLVGAIAPGVLVGAALAEGYPGLDPRVLPVLSGIARFGFVGAAAACLACWSEPPARRDARLMVSSGARAWALACLPTQAALLLGASLGAGLMSLHEIEASVIVQPPGQAALAQQILAYLHFSRLEDMSSAAVWLVGGGTLLGVLAASLIALGARNRQGAGRS